MNLIKQGCFGCLAIIGVFVVIAIIAGIAGGSHTPTHDELVQEHRAAHAQDVSSKQTLELVSSVAAKINKAEYLIHTTAVSGDSLTATITVNQDLWDIMGHQEQTMMQQIFIGALDKAYRAQHHQKPDMLRVRIKNLAGEYIASY